MSAKTSWLLIVLLCAAVFSWSIYRDVQLEKQYAGDLRNRVVGARMQKDGLSPYFYKWKTGDGFRYYDPNNFDSLGVSNITASPFFHHLLRPLADLPQRSVSIWWLLITYGMFILLQLLGIAMATTLQQRRLLWLAACLFLLTEAWKMHIGNGQNYLFIPLLAMAFYYCFSRQKGWVMAFAAGCCAAMLVLIKPTAALFFLPFLVLWRQYSRANIAALLLPAVLCIIWIFTSNTELFLWQQYRQNITQQVKMHQRGSPDLQVNDKDPVFDSWEGISRAAIAAESIQHPVQVYSENGNVFVPFMLVFHKNINTASLMTAALVLILLLLTVFFRLHHINGYPLQAVAILGYCLFMISDLFSPVYRHQYYAVQWMFPVLLTAAGYRHGQPSIYIAIAAGLLLNVLNISFLPMEHTVGEYIMLAAFIVLSLRRQKTSTE